MTSSVVDLEDANDLLKFDPAAVVVVLGNTDALTRLGVFARKLTHYMEFLASAPKDSFTPFRQLQEEEQEDEIHSDVTVVSSTSNHEETLHQGDSAETKKETAEQYGTPRQDQDKLRVWQLNEEKLAPAADSGHAESTTPESNGAVVTTNVYPDHVEHPLSDDGDDEDEASSGPPSEKEHLLESNVRPKGAYETKEPCLRKITSSAAPMICSKKQTLEEPEDKELMRRQLHQAAKTKGPTMEGKQEEPTKTTLAQRQKVISFEFWKAKKAAEEAAKRRRPRQNDRHVKAPRSKKRSLAQNPATRHDDGCLREGINGPCPKRPCSPKSPRTVSQQQGQNKETPRGHGEESWIHFVSNIKRSSSSAAKNQQSITQAPVVNKANREGHDGDTPKEIQGQGKFRSTVPVRKQDQYQAPHVTKSRSLARSEMQFSMGLTRQQINEHVNQLGLTSHFDGVGAKKSNRPGSSMVSHLTLHPQWADLPPTQQEKLEWWIPEEPNLSTGSTAPLKNRPGHPAIPIFWTQAYYDVHAGHIEAYHYREVYHYVGHYRCESFDTQQKCTIKGIPRKALVEFQFVEFKAGVASKMAEIAKERSTHSPTSADPPASSL